MVDAIVLALASGQPSAGPPLAAYLVGSAYQESGFKPDQRGDYVKGQPTSFGLMQVGSEKLASGSVTEQFRNYISALQSRAPDTWKSMNAAPTPEDAYVAQHVDSDWRMGIPGNRFSYARQVMSAPPPTETPPPTVAAGVSPALQSASASIPAPAGINDLVPGPSFNYDKFNNTVQASNVAQDVGGALASSLSSIGKGMQQSSQQGMQQALAMLHSDPRAQQALAQLAANPWMFIRPIQG